MNIGKEWQWPSPEELVDWEAKIRRKHTRAISPGNQLLLIKAVRSQRKAIEKIVKMLVSGNGSVEGGGDMRGPEAANITGGDAVDTPRSLVVPGKQSLKPSDLDSLPAEPLARTATPGELRRQIAVVDQLIVSMGVRICEIDDNLGLAKRQRNEALNRRAGLVAALTHYDAPA